MTTEPRTLRASEWDVWYDKLMSAFAVTKSPEERELDRSLTEPERSIGVWDGDEPVGTAGLLSFRMAVPGGAVVPTAGVTMVSVAATHRRRGVLRSMMRRQLEDLRASGREPLVGLTASEPEIYGRFGYGLAARALWADIDTGRVALELPRELAADAARLRLRQVDEAAVVRDACEAVYARRVPERPGMLERGPGWERKPLLDAERLRGGASPLRAVLALRDGEPVGFARYAVRPGWSARGSAEAEVVLRDLEALDPAAHAALWQFLWGIDLTTVLRVSARPLDDPWQYLVSDVRRCGASWRDGLFLRPVEVGAALAARSYARPVDVVIEVEDDFCPWNTGRWRLSGDDKGAVCAPTREPADLSLSVRELGAAYLGGTSLAALERAGLVREARPGSGALREAATAFLSDVEPWLPHTF
ncbi:GNAT family N-acetyltransferase [Streptomyces iconiensis]|uniref:GNAT family N-acetyltransferase n=1 Tax=Streptomyces iconiensis TaxID=1384038 RepID=A0ABT7AA81_9ACTN|nr:GNAT family N-acetyltransferase [Streptomyces iconiensis]MDJ1138248.1 GNAT family N-acetyltransferase [Streptomyces iconiensis]